MALDRLGGEQVGGLAVQLRIGGGRDRTEAADDRDGEAAGADCGVGHRGDVMAGAIGAGHGRPHRDAHVGPAVADEHAQGVP